MLVQLLYLPGAVFRCGFGIKFRVFGQLHGFEGSPGADDMLPVAVLSFHRILGHHHQGLHLPVQPGDGRRHVRLLVILILDPLSFGGIHVLESQEEGHIGHPCRPDAVDGLVDPAPAGAGQIGEGARIALFRPVDGVDAAQEDPFIVGMGADDQKVRPLDGGLHDGILVRETARAQDAHLADAEHVPGDHVHGTAAFLQIHRSAQPFYQHLGREQELARPVVLSELEDRVPDGEGERGILPSLPAHAQPEIQDVHGDIAGAGPNAQHVIGMQDGVGLQISVVGIESDDFFVAGLKKKRLGDVRRLRFRLLTLRLHGNDAQQQQHRQAKDPGNQTSFLHGAHFPPIIVLMSIAFFLCRIKYILTFSWG